MQITTDRFGNNVVTVNPTGDLDTLINNALEGIQGEYVEKEKAEEIEAYLDDEIENFTYGKSRYDGKYYYRENDKMLPIEAKNVARVTAFVELAEQYDAIVDAMFENVSDEVLEKEQKKLKEKYDNYINI